MEASFWHNKWAIKEIGFHEEEPNSFLTQHFDQLDLTAGQRVFVPLCGKTLDIGWLLNKGLKVVGVELSEVAITELFEQLNITPKITAVDNLIHYSGTNIDIYVGDLFSLMVEKIGKVDAVYDRAAMVALPPEIRIQYAKHIKALTYPVPQLLVSFEYAQEQMSGPPFAVHRDELNSHYSSFYSSKLLQATPVEGKLKGKVEALEIAWLLKSKS